jgi:hypothetical protein
MDGKPFHRGEVINLAQGDKVKETQLSKGPKNRLFIIEFVSINAFLQENQQLFVSLGVTTDSVTGVYPIVPTETMTKIVQIPLLRSGDLEVNACCFMQTRIPASLSLLLVTMITVPLKRLRRSLAGL